MPNFVQSLDDYFSTAGVKLRAEGGVSVRDALIGSGTRVTIIHDPAFTGARLYLWLAAVPFDEERRRRVAHFVLTYNHSLLDRYSFSIRLCPQKEFYVLLSSGQQNIQSHQEFATIWRQFLFCGHMATQNILGVHEHNQAIAANFLPI